MRPRESPPAGAPADPITPHAPVRRTDDRELQRFLKPQPPLPIPERTRPAPPSGLLARTLLGHRVYTRGQR